MAQYIKTPFASAGDKAAIPDAAQPDGSISYAEGFGVDYQLDPATDPSALDIPRDKFNQLIFAITAALQQYQQLGFPDFITTSDNGGTPFSYAKDAHVRYDDGSGFKTYYSLVSGNTSLPTDTTKWGLVVYAQPFTTGDVMFWDFATIRSGGWLWQNGTTIGNASSGATQRANADTQALFTKYWTDYSNAVLPIQDSTGAPSTRGANAAADFAANKRMPLPDKCARLCVGADNMGGITAKNRITTALSGISGVTIGAVGGIEAVQLSGNQNAPHTHNFGYINYGLQDLGALQINSVRPLGVGSEATTSSSGLAEAHQNMPPTFVGGGWIVKI